MHPLHSPEDIQQPDNSETNSCPLPTVVPTAPLPDPIGQSIEAIVALQAKAEKDVSRHQWTVERITNFFGRPSFLYSLLLIMALWILPNVLPRRLGLPRFDPPPFSELQLVTTLSALLVTAGVLVKQTRQEKLAEQRAQLHLQLSLLSEQKIAKLIALVEELRADLPNVADRRDIEAEAMQQAADPHQVIETLEKTLEGELTRLRQQDAPEP